MGARLVAAAMSATWSHLGNRDRLVLVAMSLTALDTAKGDLEAGRYYGGHGYLSVALTGADDDLGRQAVKRAVAALIKAGAITRIGEAEGRFMRATYRISTGQPMLVTDDAGPAEPVENVVPLRRVGVS
ncbi:hypothetical protein ACQCX5_14445 [Propionibacteriaceae bacterium G57]|uniref:hypothetical protein n=1 Tax=Aestuariimicrobium sp. G57 TaxID=3418485 RepID=UPI003DA74895